MTGEPYRISKQEDLEVKLIKKGDGQEPKEAKRHFAQSGITKVSKAEGSRRLHVSVSHFLPKGGAEMYDSATERVYYCLSGALMVKGNKGDEYLVEQGDTLYIPPDEERSIETVGTEPATMLVIIVNLD